MRALTFTLFVVGVLVSLTAFAADHATSIPFVLRLFAPTYYSASIGRQHLEDARELRPSDRGFAETADIVIGALRKQNPPEKLLGVSITQFSLGAAGIGFSATHAGETIPLEVQLSTGDTVRADVSLLDQLIAAQKESATFRYAFIAFLLGTVVEATAFFLEFFRRHAESSRAPI